MANLFVTFKLPLPLVDVLVRKLREVLGEIKDHERRILDLDTRKAKMPRKDFIRSWEGNQTNFEWVDDVLKRKEKWSSGVREVKDQIIAEQEATIQIPKMTRVDLADIKAISRTMTTGKTRARQKRRTEEGEKR